MNQRPYDKADAMAVAGFVCGVIGCITMCMGVSAIFFGALALFFGLLARGDSIRINKKSRAAVILGIISMIAGAAICARTAYVFVSEYGTIENAVNSFLEIYNETYEELYNSFY